MPRPISWGHQSQTKVDMLISLKAILFEVVQIIIFCTALLIPRTFFVETFAANDSSKISAHHLLRNPFKNVFVTSFFINFF